jgi:hypothetical protein
VIAHSRRAVMEAGRRLWLHYGAALPGVGVMTTE